MDIREVAIKPGSGNYFYVQQHRGPWQVQRWAVVSVHHAGGYHISYNWRDTEQGEAYTPQLGGALDYATRWVVDDVMRGQV